MTITIPARRWFHWGNAHPPWSSWAWRNTTFVTAGVPVHLVALVIFAGPWVFFVPVSTGDVLIALTASVALPVAGLRLLTAVQRHRFWALLGPPGTARLPGPLPTYNAAFSQPQTPPPDRTRPRQSTVTPGWGWYWLYLGNGQPCHGGRSWGARNLRACRSPIRCARSCVLPGLSRPRRLDFSP
jgi:hypothetical protein